MYTMCVRVCARSGEVIRFSCDDMYTMIGVFVFRRVRRGGVRREVTGVRAAAVRRAVRLRRARRYDYEGTVWYGMGRIV